jgi:hypothetical protein
MEFTLLGKFISRLNYWKPQDVTHAGLEEIIGSV